MTDTEFIKSLTSGLDTDNPTLFYLKGLREWNRMREEEGAVFDFIELAYIRELDKMIERLEGPRNSGNAGVVRFDRYNRIKDCVEK